MKSLQFPRSSVVPAIVRYPLAPLFGVLLCLAPIASTAQNVTFAGAETVLPTSGLNAATGVAVDSSGNVVISDYYNQRAVLLSKTPTGYAPQVNLPTVGLGSAYGIAVDSAGDVFIPNGPDGRIVELPKTATGYGPQIVLPCTTCGFGSTVALDLAGDVFFPSSSVGNAWELPWTGTGYGPQTILPTDLNYPLNNFAADAAGDVFIVAAGNNSIVELPKTSTGYGPQTTLPFSGLGLYGGGGVAVDSAGNDVIVADVDNNRVVQRQMGGYGPQITLLTGPLNFPRGLFLDSAGDLFIADQNNDRVLELQTVSVNFGGANVCAPGATTPAPCSQTLTLNFKVNADATLGTPEVLTGGMAHQDFVRRGSGTTCTGAVTAGTTCTVKVTFAPLAAGFRNGAVNLTDGSGNFISKTLLSGFGVATTTGAPAAQLSTNYLQFGAVAFGEIETLPLMVANVGGRTLTVAPSIDGHSYSIANSTCAAGVAPGNSCVLTVEFSPTSIATHNDLLTLDTNAGDLTVNLVGAAIGLSVSDPQLNFGTVASGSTEILPLTITNVGLPGTVTVGTTITGHSFNVLTTSENTCLAGIAPGQSCTLPVEFAPTMSGNHADLLTLTPAPGGGSTTVWLAGTTP